MPVRDPSPRPSWQPDDDDWDEEYNTDSEADDQFSTTDCIHCGLEIYDDAPQCPYCGEYQIGNRTLTAWQGRPLWWKIGGWLGIIAVLFGLLAFCF